MKKVKELIMPAIKGFVYTGGLLQMLLGLAYIVVQGSFAQTLFGLLAGYMFARNWIKKKHLALAASLWLNTLPFMAQVQSMYFIYAVCSWGLLLLMGLWMRTVAKEGLFGLKQVLLVLFFLLTAVLFGNYLDYEATGQATPKSLAAMYFERAGTSVMSGKYMVYMPREVTELFTEEDLEQIGTYPHMREPEFEAVLEKQLGEDRAQEILWELGNLGAQNATMDTIKLIAKDWFGYVLPMGSYFTWSNGETHGATSWNYQRFTAKAPQLSVAYVQICSVLWLIGSLVSLLVLGAKAILTRQPGLKYWLPGAVSVLLYGLILALGAHGTYDYKKALLPMVLGCLPMGQVLYRYIFKK